MNRRVTARGALSTVVLVGVLTLGCGGGGGGGGAADLGPVPDTATPLDLSTQTGCVGTGSCAAVPDGMCQAAEHLGLGCTPERADFCAFGGVLIGTPSDPGCGAHTTQPECVGFNVGCRWNGSACEFKVCHQQEDESTCLARGCVWAQDDCFYNDCPTLGAQACAGAHGCTWWQDYVVGCTGTYACADASLVIEGGPQPTAQQVCEGVAEAGFACTWVP